MDEGGAERGPGRGAAHPVEGAADHANLEALKAFPVAPLGDWPSPIDQITLPGGAEVLIKRDDLSGYGRGGAKTRKIETILGHMQASGYDRLVTVAGNVTNVVFDMLPAIDRSDLEIDLFIIDDPPARPEDREEIFAGVRDRVTLAGTNRVGIASRVGQAAWRAWRRGERPFVSPPGLAHPAGVIGNAKGFIEMVEQRVAQDLPTPSTVFITAATGSTIAGFLLAEHALRLAGHEPITLHGVQVYPGGIERWTWGLIRWTERFLRLKPEVPRDRIVIDDAALAGGFAHFPERIAALCDRVAEDAGIHVDPIFGGKTWSVMEDTLRDRDNGPRPALYWHCGYTPEWRVLGQVVEAGATP